MSDSSGIGSMPPKAGAWLREGELRIWYDRYSKIYAQSIPSSTKGWQLPAIMGMSFEGLLAFMRGVPRRDCSVMDAGCGFSTWMLRKAFDNVLTVDPPAEAHIGAIVCGLCGKHKLTNGTYVLGFDNAMICDYVLYDYGHFPERIHELPAAWEKTRVAMYLDDADDRYTGYSEVVHRFAEAEGAILTECREAIDVHGRWGVWLHRADVDMVSNPDGGEQ